MSAKLDSDGHQRISHVSPEPAMPAIVRAHDYFNLVSIALLNVLNLYYICNIDDLSFFKIFFWTTAAYFVCDSAFVGIFPNCVKSPVTILFHHIVTSCYMLIPFYYPSNSWCMAYCMLIEINTWFLIAKRNIKSVVLEFLFYASWILLRNIWYPYLIYSFYHMWRQESQRVGSPWNPILLAPIFQTFLTGLNFHWTRALLWRTTKSKHL